MLKIFTILLGTKPYQEPILWRNDIVFIVAAFVFVFILMIIFSILQIYKSQKRKEDFALRKAFVRDSIRRRSQSIEKFNTNGKKISSNCVFQPKIIPEINPFAQKWKENPDTSKKIVNSYAGNETIYDTCSSASSLSNFCNAQTHSCYSTESILNSADVKKKPKKIEKDSQKEVLPSRFIFIKNIINLIFFKNQKKAFLFLKELNWVKYKTNF